MNLEKPARYVLRYLFAEYKKGPSVIYPINEVVRKFGVDPVDLSDYLLDKGWIRERWIYAGDDVACRITIKGIERIDRVYFRNKVDQIISGIASAGSSKALLEILEFNIEEYAIASDFVNQLERLGLVKIQNPDNTITVELTDAGRKYHEKKMG